MADNSTLKAIHSNNSQSTGNTSRDQLESAWRYIEPLAYSSVLFVFIICAVWILAKCTKSSILRG